MTAFELLIIAVGVAMDAFAVSVCKGMSVSRVRLAYVLLTAFWFGSFQALMPLIGYFAGVNFTDLVSDVDHWIAFVLLAYIGFKLMKDSFKNDDECVMEGDFSVRTMLMLAVATSIDALAVGVSFAFLKVNIWVAVLVIGVVTALFSGAGVLVGNVFGCRFKSRAEQFGGAVLILMGIKILVEHLFFS